MSKQIGNQNPDFSADLLKNSITIERKNNIKIRISHGQGHKNLAWSESRSGDEGWGRRHWPVQGGDL